MSFDPMAAAVDWLDAYRAGDIEAILGMYAESATIQCSCGETRTIANAATLRLYWSDRLRHVPASELDNLEPLKEGIAISYVVTNGVVGARLTFDAAGLIVLHSCGPVEPSYPLIFCDFP